MLCLMDPVTGEYILLYKRMLNIWRCWSMQKSKQLRALRYMDPESMDIIMMGSMHSISGMADRYTIKDVI